MGAPVQGSWPVPFFQRRGIYYGWVIVAAMFVTLFISLGFRFAFGVFYSALLDETGWSRAETAWVISVAMGVYALTAALSGYLYDRLGARVLFTGGALLMGAGLMLCSTIKTLSELVLYYGVIIGLSYAALGFIPHMAIVPRWFSRRRGFANSLSLAGVGLGSLAIAAGSAELIQAIGWRATLWHYGIASMAVLIPVNLILHRDSAQSLGLHPDGRQPGGGKAAHPPDSHMTVRAALINRNFWWLFAAVTMIGLVTMTMIVHQTRMLVDVGFSLSLASLIFGMLGVTRAVGGLFWGPLSDRIGRAACVVIICVASFFGLGLLLLLPYLPPDAGGLRMALLAAYLIAFGLGYNGMSPVFASTVSDHFAGRNLGTIMGLLDLGFGVGAALGPWAGGWVFDRVGGYGWMVAGVMAGIVITGISLGTAGRKFKPA